MPTPTAIESLRSTPEQPGISLQDFGKGKLGHQIGVEKMEQVLNAAFTDIYTPDISTVALYRLFAEKLPYISKESQLEAVNAIQSKNPDLSAAGIKVFTLLNMKPILSAAEPYFTGNPDLDDDLIQAGIAHLLESIPKEKTDNQINNLYQYVYALVQTGIAEEIAHKENLPVGWIKNNTHELIVGWIEQAFVHYPAGLTKEQISDMAAQISQETGIPTASIESVIKDRNSLLDRYNSVDEEDLVDTIFPSVQKRALEETLNLLTDGQATVIRARFFKEKTTEETARLIGKSPTRVEQLKAAALHSLRYSKFKRTLRACLFPEDHDVIRRQKQHPTQHEFIDMKALTEKSPNSDVCLVEISLIDPIRFEYRYTTLSCWDDKLGLLDIYDPLSREFDFNTIPHRLRRRNIHNLAQLLTASDSKLQEARINPDQIAEIKTRVIQFLEEDKKTVTIGSSIRLKGSQNTRIEPA
ncbi:sigma-70 family RNA polymerase sigma factor [Candidatus Daviesbacteria bacterium]|nr:sigma-70 family RNA polymerase sigma factor [Candidatus Daviesbacteria bacterium]